MVQISWSHMCFMLYLDVAMLCMLLIQPYLFKVSKTPIRTVLAFGLYWPIHAIPGITKTMIKRLRRWRKARRERAYKRWKAQMTKHPRDCYVTVRSRHSR